MLLSGQNLLPPTTKSVCHCLFPNHNPPLPSVLYMNIQFVGQCNTALYPLKVYSDGFLATSGQTFDLVPRRTRFETVSFSKLLNLSKSPLLHLLNGDDRSYLSVLLCDLHEITCVGEKMPSNTIFVICPSRIS